MGGIDPSAVYPAWTLYYCAEVCQEEAISFILCLKFKRGWLYSLKAVSTNTVIARCTTTYNTPTGKSVTQLQQRVYLTYGLDYLRANKSRGDCEIWTAVYFCYHKRPELKSRSSSPTDFNFLKRIDWKKTLKSMLNTNLGKTAAVKHYLGGGGEKCIFFIAN